jgi:hypothetical protein
MVILQKPRNRRNTRTSLQRKKATTEVGRRSARPLWKAGERIARRPVERLPEDKDSAQFDACGAARSAPPHRVAQGAFAHAQVLGNVHIRLLLVAARKGTRQLLETLPFAGLFIMFAQLCADPGQERERPSAFEEFFGGEVGAGRRTPG